MTQINPQLLSAIRSKTGLSRAQAYERIKQTATREYLPRGLAAIKVAADVGVTISKYASPEQLAELRRAGSPVTPPTNDAQPEVTRASRPVKARNLNNTRSKAVNLPNQVFVVHGRDLIARESVFAFLRSIGVKPIEWNSAIKLTNKASPYIGEILQAAFSKARAVVVLLTPDDWAFLREDLRSNSDPPYEGRPTGQARANVLFEAGMAFSSHPDRTILVQLGTIRPFSDTAGRHVLQLTNAAEKRLEFATKLTNAGCDVDTSGADWLKQGDFSDPESRIPKPKKARPQK